MTPAQYKCAMDGVVERLKNEYEQAHQMIWWQAFLNRTVKFPTLAQHTKSIKRKKVQENPDDGLAAWAAHQRALNKEASR